jgi:two-component system, OmpR family, phosphate regulon sensor histidine kinase PhoR
MKRKQLLNSFAGAAAALAFLTSMIAAAFFLTALVYERTGYYPPAVFIQIINALLGIFAAFLILFALGSFFVSKRIARQMGLFGPIIAALERIAKGDFTVRIDDPIQDNGFVTTLVKSVNTMALELNQMESMRQEFISTVSHEIQSPLTSIRGFARALQNDQLNPAERLHYLNIIETESMRLSKLSDNLLELAALDAENRKFEPQCYRLDKQIRNVVLACEPQWMEKALELDVSLEEVAITADEDLLNQVWINLLHNSIKFTPHGGHICVDLRIQDGNVVFRLTDTGIGIAEEDQAHVFERFFKADKSRERAKGGNGLGLAIAHKIIDMHHGTIGVTSTRDVGTTFSVSLPQ